MIENKKQIHEMCARIDKSCATSQKRKLWPITMFISFIMFISAYEGIFNKIVPSDCIAGFASMIFVLSLVAFMSETVYTFISVLLLKEAIRKLRYPEWGFLNFVILGRSERSKKVLSNPAVIFIIGHLFKRLGYESESKNLIDKAIKISPALAEITFLADKALSAADEKKLVSDIELIAKSNVAFRIWSNRKARLTFIIIGVVVIAVNIILQLIKISNGVTK